MPTGPSQQKSDKLSTLLKAETVSKLPVFPESLSAALPDFSVSPEELALLPLPAVNHPVFITVVTSVFLLLTYARLSRILLAASARALSAGSFSSLSQTSRN